MASNDLCEICFMPAPKPVVIKGQLRSVCHRPECRTIASRQDTSHRIVDFNSTAFTPSLIEEPKPTEKPSDFVERPISYMDRPIAYCDASMQPLIGYMAIAAVVYEKGELVNAMASMVKYDEDDPPTIQEGELKAVELALLITGEGGMIVSDNRYQDNTQFRRVKRMLMDRRIRLLYKNDCNVPILRHKAAHDLCTLMGNIAKNHSFISEQERDQPMG